MPRSHFEVVVKHWLSDMMAADLSQSEVAFYNPSWQNSKSPSDGQPNIVGRVLSPVLEQLWVRANNTVQVT